MNEEAEGEAMGWRKRRHFCQRDSVKGRDHRDTLDSSHTKRL